jgi:hypothetical protein
MFGNLFETLLSAIQDFFAGGILDWLTQIFSSIFPAA